jgi:hypothetical protein
MSWFPLSQELMEATPDFTKLPTKTKLFYFLLVSWANLKHEFFMSDKDSAIRLRTCTKTIQRARNAIDKLGFIRTLPGISFNGENRATRYLYVKHFWPSNGFFAQIQRLTFNALMYRLFKGTLSAEDVLVYVYLAYWFWKHHVPYRERGYFYIEASRLSQLTRVSRITERINNLHDHVRFSDGGHLFNTNIVNKLVFRNWRTVEDTIPNRVKASDREAEIRLRVEESKRR